MEYIQTALPFTETPQQKGGLDTVRPSRKGRSKLFFILRPPQSIREEIYTLALDYASSQNGIQVHPADLLHITLLSIAAFDRVPYELISRIDHAIGTIQARPIMIRLDCGAIFGNRRHLVLTSSAQNIDLCAFVGLLHHALSRHNLPRQVERAISPHVTMIYGYGNSPFPTVSKTYSWLASEFALVFSHNGERRHEELGTWRLDEDAPPYAEQPVQLCLATEPTSVKRNAASRSEATS